jgi:PAS domain S-box-containing protein
MTTVQRAQTSSWPTSDGEMAERIRAHDWAATPLGPIESWPQSLKTAVGIMLNVPQPMWIGWGTDVIQLYNDAYIAFLDAERHPALLGQPAAEGWADIWHLIGPDLQAILAGGPAVVYPDRLVPYRRGGEVRDFYFTYSYSPIPDPSASHGIGGVLCVAIEMTAAVALRGSDERQAYLLKLSDALRPLEDPVDIQLTACRILGEHTGVSRVLYGDVVDERVVVISRNYVDGVAPIIGNLNAGDFGEVIIAAYQRKEKVVFSNVATDPRFTEADRRNFAAIDVVANASLGLLKGGRWVAVMGMHHATPREWTPGDISLLEETAERTWAAVERARAEAALRERQESQHFLLRFGDALRSLTDETEILRTAAGLLGEYLQADRAFFGELFQDEDLAVMHPDYARGDLPSLAGRYRISDFRETVDALQGGRPFVIPDVASSEVLSEQTRSAYLGLGYASFFSVPLFKHGRLVLDLSAVSGQTRSWTADQIHLTQEIAERTWMFVERARAEAALRISEERLRVATRSARISTFEIDVATGMVMFDANILVVLYGFESEEVDQRPHDWRPLVEGWLRPADAKRHTELLLATMRGEGDLHHELLVRNPESGAETWIEAYASLVRDAAGRPSRVVGIMRNITEHKRVQAERERLAATDAVAAERQALLKRIVRVQEEERARVSREIHDSVTQLAHAAAIHLDNAVELLDGTPAPARAGVERGRDLARQAAQEARRLIAGLRPETLDTLGLAGAINQEVEVLRAAGWRVDYEEGDLAGVRLEPEAEITLFRVVQEALSNVRKHAGHARVRVRLRRTNGSVRLEVRDWGRGFDPQVARARSQGEQVGLVGMRERMHLLGGRLEVRSSLETGTTIRASLSLHAPHEPRQSSWNPL